MVNRLACLSAAVLSLLLTLVGPGSRSVAAHGGGTLQVASASAGPYLLNVWISPDPVRAGRALHVTVGVATAVEADEPVLDAVIEIRLFTTGAVEPVASTRATTEQSVNKLLYEADVTVTEPGTYIVDITVVGPEGSGKSVFAIEVEPGTNGSWLAVGLPIAGVALVAAIIWGWKRRSHEHMRPE